MAYEIFVPFDGSDCALRALEHAVTLAQRIGECSIHIAHAHEEPLIYGEIARSIAAKVVHLSQILVALVK